MGCCGKTITKVRHIAIGYTNLIRGKKCLDTDKRTRTCQGCSENYWLGRSLWCRLCKCYIPAKARVEDEKCPLDKW